MWYIYWLISNPSVIFETEVTASDVRKRCSTATDGSGLVRLHDRRDRDRSVMVSVQSGKERRSPWFAPHVYVPIGRLRGCPRYSPLATYAVWSGCPSWFQDLWIPGISWRRWLWNSPLVAATIWSENLLWYHGFLNSGYWVKIMSMESDSGRRRCVVRVSAVNAGSSE